MFVKMLRLLLFKLTETLWLKYMQIKQAYVWSAVHATTLNKQKAKDSQIREAEACKYLKRFLVISQWLSFLCVFLLGLLPTAY